MAARVAGIVTTIVAGGCVGYASAAGRPVPGDLQAKYIGAASVTTAVIGMSVAAVSSSAPIGMVAGLIAGPVATLITYGTGYYAGKIVQHTVTEKPKPK